MKSLLKRLIFFVLIVLLAASAAWIVWPKGSRISLKSLKIPFEQTYRLHLGLDLQGGSRLVYKANFKDIQEQDRATALAAVRDTIERRVNSFGVSEPLVQAQGQDQIVVELPGIKDINEAIKQIGQTPLLEFRIPNPNPGEVQPTINDQGQITIDPTSQWSPSGLSGKQLKRATADIQGAAQGRPTSEVVVRLEFNDEGRELFANLTSQNVGKPIAIFLDGKPISTPTVQTPITDGIAIITGNFNPQTAKELANRLNSGALPVPIELVSQQNVGATLGAESVQKSIIAGLMGMLLIALFMITYYRFPGLLAIFALIIYALISLAVFKIGISVTAVILVGIFFFLGLTVSAWFGVLALLSYLLLITLNGVSPVTLTLAGIAGFILSIGMAVDANILIFERMKEEVRAGKPISQAIEDGFQRAWLSIRDSNVSSLITIAILYFFGTPSIKGFAITLGIGILISMFTAITITRTLLKLFLGNRVLAHPWLFGVSRKETSQHEAA